VGISQEGQRQDQPSKSNTFQANATPGTHPITRIVYYIGERTACITTTAPYKCSFKATDADVGKDTLVAIATDSIGLTSTLTRTITVSTFTARSSPRARSPRRQARSVRVHDVGQAHAASGVTKKKGCSGMVSVTFKDGRKKVGSGTTKLRSNCAFSSR